MPNRRTKVIIDINLWISYLINNNYRWLDNLIKCKKIELIFSDELLSEFIDVVKRPKLSKYFSYDDINRLLLIIKNYASFQKVCSNIEICRDRKDNFLLSLAADSNANYLLTGDLDLLEIKQIHKTRIITINQFKEIFKENLSINP